MRQDTKQRKIYPVTSKTVLGLGGLITDAQTFSNKLQYESRMYKLEHGREMNPKVVAKVTSKTLYEKRWSPFFLDPLVAGIDRNGNTYVAGMDLIGATETPNVFVTGGTSADMITGITETVAQNLTDDTPPKEVMERLVEAVRSGVNRDCLV